MRKLLIALFTSIILIIVYSCGGSSMGGYDDVLKVLNLKEIPSQLDYPDDDAIIIKETHKVEMTIKDNWKLETKEQVYIAKKIFRNLEKYSEVEIDLSESEHLEGIEARTIKPDGSFVKVEDKDFYWSKGKTEGSTFYLDEESVKFTFPALEKNCIIEYTYTIRKDFPFIMDVWYIQDYDPILYNKYELTLPVILLDPVKGAGWKWRYRAYNYKLKEPEQIKNVNPGEMSSTEAVTFNWAVQNVKPLRYEKMMPPVIEHLGYVKFAPSEWENWTNVTKWYYKNYFQPQLKITPKIKQKAEELTSNLLDEKTKIEKLFQFTQNLRYVSIALGDGTIRPHEPEEVLKNEYGDCKDKSTLLIALLRSIDIKAKSVLVKTANKGKIDKDFPNWNFNHMIVQVETADGKKIWLDPTVKYCPVGEIPWTCEDVQVIVLNDDGSSSLASTPMSFAGDNQNKINIKLNIISEEEVVFDVNMIVTGENNLEYKNALEDISNDGFKKFIKSFISDDFLNAEILDYSISKLEDVNSNLEINFKFKVNNAFQKQGDLYFLNINPYKILSWDMSFLSQEERNFDIRFPYLFKIEKNIDVNYPTEKFTIRNIPEDVTINNKQFVYFKTIINKEGQVKFNELFTLTSRNIKPTDYKNFVNSFEKIKTKQQEKIIFIKI
ncbi:MAG: DUF3857 domain-containing protein [Ignavibacteriales bacterium]|nr:DUF3857 domain-containing protein [Ignavibacteriales bacterium]